MDSDKSQSPIFGGIEAGGTKFVCAIGPGSNELRSLVEIPTREPEATLAEAIDFFRSQSGGDRQLAGIGIGSFGPLQLNRDAADFGHITNTPKSEWQNVDIRGEFVRAFGLPVAIDTDVNAAAIGELHWGATRDLQHCLYVTVGTGVGVGAIVGGRIFSGVQHSEMGHMLVPISRAEPEGFTGICPYHQSCVEGLASGAAIVQRWGSRLSDLPQDHPAWGLEAHYLSALVSNLTFAFQPQRIVIGGGVMNQTLVALLREKLQKNIAGYRQTLATPEAIEDYLVLPQLDGRAGVLGAIAMAKQEASGSWQT